MVYPTGDTEALAMYEPVAKAQCLCADHLKLPASTLASGMYLLANRAGASRGLCWKQPAIDQWIGVGAP